MHNSLTTLVWRAGRRRNSMLDTRGVGLLLADLHRDLSDAGVEMENIVAEAAPGQHEIVLACRDALTTADNHAFAKFAAKQIVAACGHSLTFMAKLDQNAGNACHIHFSLRTDDQSPVFAGDGAHGFSPTMQSFLAGQIAFLPELTLLLAPNINSYKRFVAGSYAPTAISWGYDNRTCALRVVGSGKSLRLEHRLAGADVNPYSRLPPSWRRASRESKTVWSFRNRSQGMLTTEWTARRSPVRQYSRPVACSSMA